MSLGSFLLSLGILVLKSFIYFYLITGSSIRFMVSDLVGHDVHVHAWGLSCTDIMSYVKSLGGSLLSLWDTCSHDRLIVNYISIPSCIGFGFPLYNLTLRTNGKWNWVIRANLNLFLLTTARLSFFFTEDLKCKKTELRKKNIYIRGFHYFRLNSLFFNI